MAGLVRGHKGLIYPTNFAVSEDTATVQIGYPYQIPYTITPANATNQKINWTSSNTSIATVDNKGIITAIAVGNCTVTGVYSYDGTTVNIAVATTEVHTTGILFDKHTLEIAEGGVDWIHATITPNNTSYPGIIWTSSDTNIAIVNEVGAVSYVSVGDCIITGTTIDGGYTDTCSVSCGVRVTGITLSENSIIIEPGGKHKLMATISPGNATDKSFVRTSSDTNIAIIDERGRITYVGNGFVNITATTNDGGFTATCLCYCGISPTGITLNKSSGYVWSGGDLQLTPTITPNNATNKNVTWASSDTSVATVDSNGLVTYVANGNTIITCTTEVGGLTATCSIQGVKSTTGISLDKTSANVIRGSTLQLTATVTPNDATVKTVTWKSSNTSVATVNSSGLVTYVNTGSCTITATTVQGGYSATCSITCLNVDQCRGYTGSAQSRTVPTTGNYCIETRGAQGGGSYGGNAGAKGAYAAGKVALTTGRILCIYVGGQGGCSSSIGCHSGISGGWNGGGSGGGTYYSGGCSSVGGGGGGTDVRFNGNTLCNRFIVAGGGAGGGTQICSSTYCYQCGGGGDTSGCGSRPGTQTSAGRSGGFGQGANASVNTNRRSTTPGGGGGRYGGGGACVNDNAGSSSALVYASGGSSYTYTSSTCGNHPNKGCLGSLPLMTDAVCCGCGSSFPTASGGTETGHSGNGCVRIRIV